MDKYGLLKRFHHDLRLQVYMYDFMYVDPQTIPVEDHFTATKKNCCELQESVSFITSTKYWMEFRYICSEDYELD